MRIVGFMYRCVRDGRDRYDDMGVKHRISIPHYPPLVMISQLASR